MYDNTQTTWVAAAGLRSWRGVAPLWFGRQVLRGVLPVVVVVGETLVMVMVMVMVMFPCRRMSGLLRLYLWLTTD